MNPIANALAAMLAAPTPLPLMAWGGAYFLILYAGSASLAHALARAVDRPLETRPPGRAQIRREVTQSLRSVLLFGAGLALPWAMVRCGLARVAPDAGWLRTLAECAALILWNDLHFYAMHRGLHQWWKKAHAAHHRSIAATPFAAYSMSVPEALLLGSVMPLAMLAHDFSIAALLFLPLWSICINAVAHSNTDFFPSATPAQLRGFVKAHQLHHSHYLGHFGFLFPQLDRWFGTLPDQPAKSR